MRFLTPLVLALGLIAGALTAAFVPLHAETTAAPQDIGAVQDNTALQGTNLTYYAADFGRCQADCANNSQCRGFTWIRAGTYNPGDAAMCYLMSSVTGQNASRGHVSVVKGSGGGAVAGGSREEGTALQGTNLTYYAKPDFAGCQADCAGNPQCKGFTWIAPGTYSAGDPAMCYLMASVTGRSPARGHVSMVGGGGTRAGGGTGRSGRNRLPGTTTAGPLGGGGISSAGATVAPGWGVWASASGGQWGDPCAIQYAAAPVANNRYDNNPGYRRVRTRNTQQEADLDIDHFGRYHRNQPDGVVKMQSCEGPADLLGTEWSESEGGWGGRWVRRGQTSTFDATWNNGGWEVKAVLTISISGNRVSVHRVNASDNNSCQYEGILTGKTVRGTYRCTSGGGDWSATIR